MCWWLPDLLSSPLYFVRTPEPPFYPLSGHGHPQFPLASQPSYLQNQSFPQRCCLRAVSPGHSLGTSLRSRFHTCKVGRCLVLSFRRERVREPWCPQLAQHRQSRWLPSGVPSLPEQLFTSVFSSPRTETQGFSLLGAANSGRCSLRNNSHLCPCLLSLCLSPRFKGFVTFRPAKCLGFPLPPNPAPVGG